MNAEERLNKATGLVNEMTGKVNAIFAEYVPMLQEILPEMVNGYEDTLMEAGIGICDRGLQIEPRYYPYEYPQTGAEALAQGWEQDKLVGESCYEHWHKIVNGVELVMLFRINKTSERTD